MTVSEFCLHHTNVQELVVITDGGWIRATTWLDYEDIFVIPECYRDKEVQKDEWGELTIVNKDGEKSKIPCHYIEIDERYKNR